MPTGFRHASRAPLPPTDWHQLVGGTEQQAAARGRQSPRHVIPFRNSPGRGIAAKLASILDEFRDSGHGNLVIEAPAGSKANIRPLVAGAKTDGALDQDGQTALAQLGFERIGDRGAGACRLADAAIDAHHEMIPARTRAIRIDRRDGVGSEIAGGGRGDHAGILYSLRRRNRRNPQCIGAHRLDGF